MMNESMACGLPMMIGMALVATLLVVTLALIAAAAIKYLRSGAGTADRSLSRQPTGGR